MSGGAGATRSGSVRARTRRQGRLRRRCRDGLRPPWTAIPGPRTWLAIGWLRPAGVRLNRLVGQAWSELTNIDLVGSLGAVDRDEQVRSGFANKTTRGAGLPTAVALGCCSSFRARPRALRRLCRNPSGWKCGRRRGHRILYTDEFDRCL